MSRITFQKRQKEMKRQEKQRMKIEKRAQRKLSKNSEAESPVEGMDSSAQEPDASPQSFENEAQ